MAANTGILWTDHTFNGWWGCTRVGPGCDHCYAADLDKRAGGDHWGSGIKRRLTSDRNWNEPLRWNKQAAARGVPFKVFASSMCDVFDNEVLQSWRERLWERIEETPWLRWQILTKRIGNAEHMLPTDWKGRFPLNVGVMATVVNQPEAWRDVPKLLKLKAEWGIPWVGLSIEPMLGPVDLECLGDVTMKFNAFTGAGEHLLGFTDTLGTGVDWVIWGGESGPQSRPCDLAWGISLSEQCQRNGVAFFSKQAGDRPVFNGKEVKALGPKGHRVDLLPAPLRVREFPEALLT